MIYGTTTRRLNLGRKAPVSCHTNSRPGGTIDLGIFGPNRVTDATKASKMICNILNSIGCSPGDHIGAFTRIGCAARLSHLKILLYVGNANVLGT